MINSKETFNRQTLANFFFSVGGKRMGLGGLKSWNVPERIRCQKKKKKKKKNKEETEWNVTDIYKLLKNCQWNFRWELDGVVYRFIIGYFMPKFDSFVHVCLYLIRGYLSHEWHSPRDSHTLTIQGKIILLSALWKYGISYTGLPKNDDRYGLMAK